MGASGEPTRVDVLPVETLNWLSSKKEVENRYGFGEHSVAAEIVTCVRSKVVESGEWQLSVDQGS